MSRKQHPPVSHPVLVIRTFYVHPCEGWDEHVQKVARGEEEIVAA